MTPFKVPLAVPKNYVSPWVNGRKFSIYAIEDEKDLVGGTRSLKIKNGLIWMSRSRERFGKMGRSWVNYS